MSYLATQVWFVHEYNDRADIAAGGSPWLGPWVRIPNDYLSQFLEHAHAKYEHMFRNHIDINIGDVIEIEKELPSYESVFEYAEKFLSVRKNWGFDGTKISNQDMFDYFTRANKYNLKVALNIVNYFPWSDTYICNVVKNLCPNTLPDNYILDLFMKSINTYPNPSPVILLYLNDEQRKPEQLPKIFETYNYIKSHYTIPVMQTMMLDSKQTLEKNSMFLKPFSRTSDILSVDPYPLGYANEPISAVSSQAKALNIAQNNMKPYMIINQLHGGSNYFTESPTCKNINCNDPTYIQQKNMVYQSLINNAKGIVLYSYFDLFKENNKMLSEQQFLEKWKPVSLLGLELKNLSNILMQGKDLENSNTNNLKYRVIQYNKKLYILVCNVTSSPQTISLKINKSFKNISLISDANIQTKLKSKYFGLSKSVNITILPLGSGYIVIN